MIIDVPFDRGVGVLLAKKQPDSRLRGNDRIRLLARTFHGGWEMRGRA
jgi:hypothetical protein